MFIPGKKQNFIVKLTFSILLFAAVLFFTVPANVQAGGKNAPVIKIAVVNMDTLFNNYHKTAIEEAKLQKQAEIYQEYAQQLAESLKKLRAEFITLRDGSQNVALSATERENRRLNAADKYNQFKAKEQELKEYSRTKQSQLRDEQDKMRQNILKDIRKAITTKCQMEGINLVLDTGSKIPGEIPSVIYVSGTLDITSDILTTLNRGLKAPAKSNKK